MITDAHLKGHDLSESAKKVLLKLATAETGVLREALATIVAPIIPCSLDDANKVILELYGKNLLEERLVNNLSWVTVKYSQLGISPDQVRSLTTPTKHFEVIGSPHSHEGINTLGAFFRSDDTIYVLLSVTSHTTFPFIVDRSRAKQRTIFLLPPKSAQPSDRKTHYDEILSQWIAFLRSGDASLREHVTLLISSNPYPDALTSGLSKQEARINANRIGAGSREGTVIHAKNGTTLYSLFQHRVASLLDSARPLWSLNKSLYTRWILGRAVWPLALATTAIVLAMYTNPYAALGVSLAAGMLRAWIQDRLPDIAWNPSRLLKK